MKERDVVKFDEHVSSVVGREVARSMSSTRPKWYQLNPAQWITVVSVVAGILVTYGKNETRLINDEKDVARHDLQITEIHKLNETVALDRRADHITLESHEARLVKLEDVNKELALLRQQGENISNSVSELKSQVNTMSSSFTGFQIDFSRYQAEHQIRK